MRRFTLLGAVLAPALVSGCIVLDQVTTLTVRPDGSADVVVFHSNVRSTEEGAKAEEELRRKLTMDVLPPKDLNASELADPPPKEARRNQVNGLNETRVVVEGGQILAARGWTVSDDRRSALLALDEVRQLLRDSPRRVELFIEWVVEAPTSQR